MGVKESKCLNGGGGGVMISAPGWTQCGNSIHQLLSTGLNPICSIIQAVKHGVIPKLATNSMGG